MVLQIQTVHWLSIYNIWEEVARKRFPKIIMPVPFQFVQFFYNGKRDLAGFDWVWNDYVPRRIELMTEKTEHFMLAREEVGLDIYQTVKHLVQARENRQLCAAIWLFSTLREMHRLLGGKWPYDKRTNLQQLYALLKDILTEQNVRWTRTIDTSLADLYVKRKLMEAILRDDVQLVVQLVALNSHLLLKNYTVIQYYGKCGNIR